MLVPIAPAADVHASTSRVVNLAFSLDDRFAVPTAVALHSALRHLRPGVVATVYVVDCGLSHRARERLLRAARRARPRKTTLHFLTPRREGIETLHLRHRLMSSAQYGRLQLPDLLPHVDRVLYLDGDLVVRADLAEIFCADLGGQPIGACQDFHVQIVSRANGVRRWQELKLPATLPYFNSGVLLMDLSRWRDLRLGMHATQYLRTHAPHDMNIAGDQEALNAVARGGWQALDSRWNVTSHAFLNRIAPADPFVVHYTNKRKPWSPHCDHPHQELFLAELRRSGACTAIERAWTFVRIRGGQWYLAWRNRHRSAQPEHESQPEPTPPTGEAVVPLHP